MRHPDASHGDVDCEGTTACDTAPGYDGPSGVGTPDGLEMFKPLHPTAVITPPSSLTEGVAAAFSAASSSDPYPGGSIESYSWNWGDGTADSSGVSPTHTYATAGHYTVTLTVTDNYSLTSAPSELSVDVGPGKSTQAITFTSPAPTAATVGGPTYTVTAKGGGSGNPVSFVIDSSSGSACSISGSTVSFIGAGTCTIDANQAGNSNYNAAPEAKQSFAVGKGSQAITFTSSAPSAATVGGATYDVTAKGGGSGNSVSLAIDSSSGSVCSISGSTVSFIGAGTCTIDANQAGNANYSAAPQVQQSFAVLAASSIAQPLVSPLIGSLASKESTPPANSSFGAPGVSINTATGAITFKTTVSQPGSFSWLLTFQNGKFGVFTSRTSRCKSGSVRLNGKCRPVKIVFARGKTTVASAGSVSFTVKPDASAMKALMSAAKQKKGLPVAATIMFQSARGGSPVSRTESITVRLKKK